MAESIQDGSLRKKAFMPLENNPEVMSSLLHQLGVTPDIAFTDVYSIEDKDLLAFVPRPTHALLLVFPVNQTYERFRAIEDADKPEYDGSGEGEEVIWYKQTIRNACGLIGLLHAISNGMARRHIKPDSDLAQLLKSAIPLKPKERAELLYESKVLESAHETAATKGDTAALAAEASVDLHFVCFAKSEQNHLWELDGRRKGPLNRGTLDVDEDVLSEKALDLGVRSFLKRESEAGGGELRFSLVALGPSFD
ncbi:MAG: ubiquitinyl hydrolase 1 [Cirrosporium novae-zelandiae]|nr:MAG: ubiquitinyl hydrolase 1 [Cirrosporium novae-zelandiae]